MRLTRCFSPTPLVSGATVALSPSTAAHLRRVLRLGPGDAVTLFDGRGGEWTGQLVAAGRDALAAEVGEHRAVEREAPLRLVLLQGLARGERMDWVVQKATELGVAVIAPVVGRRSVVRLEGAAAERRAAHWRAVAIAACEQCGRNSPPQLLAPAPLARACEAVDPGALRLLLSPLGAAPLAARLRQAPACVALLVGPEGGLSDEEQQQARQHGFAPCRLGPRILRAETAPIAALAAILALMGDFGA